MKKISTFAGLIFVFVGSRLLDEHPHAKNLITAIAICGVFISFLIYRYLSNNVKFDALDLLLGMPIVPLVTMMSLNWYGIITISYTLIWIIFAVFAIVFLGFYFYTNVH